MNDNSRSLILSWLISTLALAIGAYIIPGVHAETLLATAIVAIVLGLINAVVKPVLLILTLPITILTLGFFLLVLNALMIWLAAAFVPGFSIAGFFSAFFLALVVSLINAVFGARDKKKD